MMNACDGRLAHNIRKQEITEKMRAVFDRCGVQAASDQVVFIQILSWR